MVVVVVRWRMQQVCWPFVDRVGACVVVEAKGHAPKQDRTTDLPLTKRVLYH